MAAQSVSIASMFNWIADTLKLVKKNFTNLIGASGLTLCLAVVISLPIFFVVFAGMRERIQNGSMAPGAFPMGGDMTLFFTMYGIMIVVGLLLFPPLLVGWLRLCRDMDHGLSVNAFNIFKPYQDRQLWLRSIRFALVAFAIYLLVFALFGLAFSGVIAGFMQDIAAQKAATLAGLPPAPPRFLLGFFLAYFCFLGVAMLLQFVYMVGLAEISLRPTPIIEALTLAMVGVFKNLLKLIVFLIGLFMGASVVIFVIALVLGIVAVLLSLISPILGMLVTLLIYIPVLLCMYPLMFAGHYFVWKSILDGDASAPSGGDTMLSA